jgi:hypothetical protein
MELTVIRRFCKPDYTIGVLMVDGDYQCDTLEDRIRDLNDLNHDGDFDDPGEGKVYGQTAIPCGRYRVVVNVSPRLKRKLPLLLDVPGFSGIRIHGGKNSKWTEGCILVGENKVSGGLINSHYHETALTNLIEGAIFNKEDVYITIKE